MNLEKLFNPSSIAVVGASEEEGKIGNIIAKNILELGYAGKAYLVNPKHAELFGRKCYTSLSEVEEEVDLAIVAIPAKFVNGEIGKNAAKIKNYIIISAGFSETNEEGKQREEELKKIAQENDLNILGPNCLGFMAPKLKLNASFGPEMPEAGNIAIVSQSGALISAIMDIAQEQFISFSHVISIGNKAVIDESDVLEYLGENPEVAVIAMYLEGIKDGRKFIETAGRIINKKPIVVLKAGKNEKSQKAISSHTGALAGLEKIMKAVFEKIGVASAETSEEFFDLMKIMSKSSAPKSEKVVVVTNAGGPGVLTTDAFSGKEIKLLEISDKTKKKLKEFLPEESSLENPVDLLGDAFEDRYKKALNAVSKESEIGSVICVLTPQGQTPVAKIASKIIQFRKKTDLNVTAAFIGGKKIERSVKKLEMNNVPSFSFSESAVRALEKYYLWNAGKNSANDLRNAESAINSERKEKVAAIIQKAKDEGRGALYFSEAREIMEMYGIKTAESWNAKGDLSGVKFPVVLKVDSDKVLHKTDKKGLVLDIKNEEDLKKSISEMENNFPGENMIIQPMLERKTEIIAGIKKDGVFGPIVVYGLGGIYTEVFQMVDFLVLPLTSSEIEKSLKRGKIKFLFEETRGQKPHNAEGTARILLGISEFAQENPQVSEFDINPLLIYNDSKEAVAVDVKIII